MLLMNILYPIKGIDTNFKTHLLIYVSKLYTEEFIIKDTETFELLITNLFEHDLLYPRIGLIQSSPYDLLEPKIIKLWDKRIFSGKFVRLKI